MKAIDTFKGINRFLSNFYPCEVEYEGVLYPSTEHAFQAAKTTDAAWREKIKEAKKPSDAKKLGKQCPKRDGWDEMRIAVMTELVRKKFSKSPFRDKLLLTFDADLIEGNTWGDVFWGVCGGVGENNLGKILMQIRSELDG